MSASDPKLVANIIPEGATGISIGLQGATLYVSKDGTAQFVIAEDDMAFEDDRLNGPDGPEGGTYWVCRLPLGEIEALRDKLNGLEFDGEKEARLAGENARLEYKLGRYALDLMAEQDKSRRAASALEAAEARNAALEAENGALREKVERAARALQPFAEVANAPKLIYVQDDQRLYLETHSEVPIANTLRGVHFRAAKEVLRQAEEKSDG